jgi:hypothetical protein
LAVGVEFPTLNVHTIAIDTEALFIALVLTSFDGTEGLTIFGAGKGDFSHDDDSISHPTGVISSIVLEDDISSITGGL